MLTVSTPIPIIMSCTFYVRGGDRVLFAVSLVLSLARFASFKWDSVKYDAWLIPVSQRLFLLVDSQITARLNDKGGG